MLKTTGYATNPAETEETVAFVARRMAGDRR